MTIHLRADCQETEISSQIKVKRYFIKFQSLSGSNEVKMKLSTFTCNKVTFLANFSTFTSLLSQATSLVTSRQRRFYCKAQIVLQPRIRRHLTVMWSVKVKQPPQHECWILNNAQRRSCNANGSRNKPIPGTALHDMRQVASILSLCWSLWKNADYRTTMIKLNKQFCFVWSWKSVE